MSSRQRLHPRVLIGAAVEKLGEDVVAWCCRLIQGTDLHDDPDGRVQSAAERVVAGFG